VLSISKIISSYNTSV